MNPNTKLQLEYLSSTEFVRILDCYCQFSTNVTILLDTY